MIDCRESDVLFVTISNVINSYIGVNVTIIHRLANSVTDLDTFLKTRALHNWIQASFAGLQGFIRCVSTTVKPIMVLNCCQTAEYQKAARSIQSHLDQVYLTPGPTEPQKRRLTMLSHCCGSLCSGG